MKAAIIAGCIVLASAFAWKARGVVCEQDLPQAKYMAMIEFCKSLAPDGVPIPDPNPRNDCLDHLKREFLR